MAILSDLYLGNKYKENLVNQYQDITTQYPGKADMTTSPVFQAGLEKMTPFGIGSGIGWLGHYAGQGIGAIMPSLDPTTAASASPFGGGIVVPSVKSFQKDYTDLLGKDPSSEKVATAKELGKWNWADAFGHETSHLGWEYEPTTKYGIKSSVWPTLEHGLGTYKADPSNPKYAGEEQWNYMHDLMYGPRSPETGNIPGQQYLETKGLINPGDWSYTPEAFNVIANSGLISEHKKAIGFGQNPFEDTRAAGQWYAQQTAAKKFKQHQLMNRRKQDMQQKIRQGEAKEELAAQKPVTTFHPSQGNVGPDTPSSTGVGGAQLSSGMTTGQHAAFRMAQGGRASYFDGGLLSLWQR